MSDDERAGRRVGGHGAPHWKSGRRSSGVTMFAPPGRELPPKRKRKAPSSASAASDGGVTGAAPTPTGKAASANKPAAAPRRRAPAKSGGKWGAGQSLGGSSSEAGAAVAAAAAAPAASAGETEDARQRHALREARIEALTRRASAAPPPPTSTAAAAPSTASEAAASRRGGGGGGETNPRRGEVVEACAGGIAVAVAGECGICLDEFDAAAGRPKVVLKRCGHVLCRPCATQLEDASTPPPGCPFGCGGPWEGFVRVFES